MKLWLRLIRSERIGRSQGGFTLIEVLMAIAVVTLVLTAVVSGVSFSVKNTRVSRERAEAVRRGQESIEWLLGQRNADGFRVLYETINQIGSSVDYCLVSLPDKISGLSVGACGEENVITGTNVTRDMHIDLTPGAVSGNADGGEINVTVTLGWDEGGKPQSSTLRSEIRDWE